MFAPRLGAHYQAPSLGGGTGVYAFLTGKARIDRQVACSVIKQKAKTAGAALWSGYEERKKTKGHEVCTKAGAIAPAT